MQALEEKNDSNKIKIIDKEVDISKPWMSDEEIEFFKSYLGKDKIVFEWGVGGSTIEFFKYVKEYYGVEHDFEWYSLVLGKIGRNVRLYYIPANVIDLKWFPVFKEGKYGDFRDYIGFVNSIGALDKKFDIVLIDGRARVECAIEVLPYLSDNAVVFIHDFDRIYYWKVLDYYYIEEIADRLVALRKRAKEEFGVGEKDRGFLIKKYLLNSLKV